MTRTSTGLRLLGRIGTALLLAACGGNETPVNESLAGAPNTLGGNGGVPGQGGNAGEGGDGTVSAILGGGAGGQTASPKLGADGFPAECNRAPALPLDATSRVRIHLHLRFGDAPLVFGEKNSQSDGGGLLPTNFRFYLAGFQLDGAGATIPATPVSSDGVSLPYGVQFVSADDSASLEFELLAPPGDYSGLSFVLGLTEGCNALSSALAPPLDEASQMKWPHLQGFLYLRLEGNLLRGGEVEKPMTVHMGRASMPPGFAPVFKLEAPLVLGAEPQELSIAIDTAAMLEAASLPTDLSDFLAFGGDEVLAGERLRRNADLVKIFSVR